MTSTIRRVLHRVLGAFAGIVLAVAILEAACKAVDVWSKWRDQRIAARISRVSEVPGVRYELVPNVTSKTPGQEIVVRVNNLGFRGPDLPIEKPTGTYRIAILGDSIAFARTLPEEKTFARRLEKKLARRVTSPRVEVINASLSGRDTWEEAALLEHEVLPLDPDLVILQICLNDHVRLPFPDEDTTLGVFGEQAWYDYSSLAALLDRKVPGFRRWHIRWVRRLGIDRRSRERVILDHFIDPEQMVSIEENWPEWSRVLLRIRDLARSRGGDVLFVVFPLDWQIERRVADSAPLLTRFAAENGIALLDLVGPFSRSPEGLLIDYTHPAAEGHKVAARAIADFILGRWLSAPPGSADAPSPPGSSRPRESDDRAS